MKVKWYSVTSFYPAFQKVEKQYKYVCENGGKYICVTVNAYDRWKCISDHANLYKRFSESRGSI